jgi:hypothetical protein
MARKSKRQVRRQRSQSLGTPVSASRSTEFDPDYTHVKTDLRRIGTLAAVFFVILVVLRFLLPYLPIG